MLSNAQETPGLEKQVLKPHIQFKPSTWRVHEFRVFGGDGAPLCRCAVLRMPDSLLLWLGSDAEPLMGAVALGMPAAVAATGPGDAGLALATGLMVGTGRAEGADAAANGLARRLAARLARPVYVCCGDNFDRLTLPLVERGLIAEIKSRPDCF